MKSSWDMMKIFHNMYSICQPNPLESSNKRDILHEHTRRKETQKYLRESCHHRIKCTVATFLAIFMSRRPLNSTILATTTHRKPERVSDGIGTQVRVRMINKWRVKMIQKRIYKVTDSSWRRDQKKKKKGKENTIVIKIVFVFNYDQYT